MDKQIIINDNLISYIEEGTGEKAVIFLHGWRSSKEVWGQVIQRIGELEGEKIRIFAIDFPGFENSPAPSKIFSVQDYAEIVKGFIEKLAIKNVVIVGHSFGGRVGIKLAALQPRTYAENTAAADLRGKGTCVIQKLVLVDSAGFVTKSFKKDFFRVLSKIVKPFFVLPYTQSFRKKIYQFIGAEDYLATPNLQKTFVNIVNEDLTEDMERITVPTLIIWGEDDKETPVEFGKKMNSIIPNSKFQILANAGHFSFLDKKDEFVKELMDFISSL